MIQMKAEIIYFSGGAREREGGTDSSIVFSELRRSNASLTNEPLKADQALAVFKVWISSSLPCVATLCHSEQVKQL